MLPRDWDEEDDDPIVAKRYLESLARWERQRDGLVGAQAASRAELEETDRRLDVLRGWLGSLEPLQTPAAQRRDLLNARLGELAEVGARLDQLAGEVTELTQSHAIGTARLLGEVPLSEPIVLVPLRLETHWAAGELMVRAFPDELSVDSHQPALTPAELESGQTYWRAAGAAGSPAELQAWDQLVRQNGPARAAWIARTTKAGPTSSRASGWETQVAARLLPDRLAVMAVSDGVLVNLAAPGAPPRFVCWSRPIEGPLDCDPLVEPEATTWLTDFAAAEQAGMAVRLAITADRAQIDLLLVVGVRREPGDLGELFGAQGFTDGLEILADFTPTNNSGSLRSAQTRRSDSDLARALIADAAQPADGSAGSQLEMILGLPAGQLVRTGGADQPRNSVRTAVLLVAGLGARGALLEALGSAGTAALPLLEPTGPAPVFRIGRQPYGVLPMTAPNHWTPRDGEDGHGLDPHLHQWALATGSDLDIDPAAPPVVVGAGPGPGPTGGNSGVLPGVLSQLPHSAQWASPDQAFAGLDQLVGPVEGETSPAAYLAQIAGTTVPGLTGWGARLTPLMAQLALAAKRAAGPEMLVPLDTALRTLAEAAADDPGRAALAGQLSATLDAISHRFDVWITAATTERLRALRAAGTPGTTRVGAFGWLSDLQRAGGRRSHGHIHAPSLAQAATAAVLRSGYLGDAAGAPTASSRLPMAVDLSSTRVQAAQRSLRAVREGQPLAAILGNSFEQNLAVAGLQQFLAAFRKLSRFRTGSALESLEDARRDRRAELAAAVALLATRAQEAGEAEAVWRDAEQALNAARTVQQGAEAAAQPYDQLAGHRNWLRDVRVPELRAQLAEIDRGRPPPPRHTRSIKVPDLEQP